jgi:hypothetical protein
MQKQITQVVQAQPYHIKLIKGQRDVFGWEITVYGTDMDTIIRELKETHERMTQTFHVRAKE